MKDKTDKTENTVIQNKSYGWLFSSTQPPRNVQTFTDTMDLWQGFATFQWTMEENGNLQKNKYGSNQSIFPNSVSFFNCNYYTFYL